MTFCRSLEFSLVLSLQSAAGSRFPENPQSVSSTQVYCQVLLSAPRLECALQVVRWSAFRVPCCSFPGVHHPKNCGFMCFVQFSAVLVWRANWSITPIEPGADSLGLIYFCLLLCELGKQGCLHLSEGPSKLGGVGAALVCVF